jgi:hypothetical protein
VSITEYERHQVFQWCEEAMGPERAAIMMRLLPPVGWHDIATRADLQALESGLRGEFAGLRGEFAGLRGEFAGLLGENAGLRGELKSVESELRGELKSVESELRGEMHALRSELRSLNAETLRTMVVAMVASNATLVGLVVAATQLA